MKKAILSLLIGFYSISAFGQYNFKIVINSETLAGKKVYLNIFNNLNYIALQRDSFFVKDGSFTLNGQVSQPSNFASLEVLDKRKLPINFVLDSGLNNISLESSGENSKFLTLKSDARGHLIYNQMNVILLNDAAHYPKATRDNSGHLKIPQELMERIKQDQRNMLKTYPSDYSSLINLYHISRMDASPDNAKENIYTLATFSDSLKSTALGKQLYTEETNLIKNKLASESGNKALIFNVRDANNLPFSNAFLKGQNYMIVFSATWCGPCQLQLPKLKKLYQAYKQKGLKVIYFNNDDNVVRWKEHIAVNKLSWINVSERLKPSESKIQKSFGVYSVPTCLIINKEGIIVYNSDKTDPGINHIESYIKQAIYN